MRCVVEYHFLELLLLMKYSSVYTVTNEEGTVSMCW